jgi:hypothetical protein
MASVTVLYSGCSCVVQTASTGESLVLIKGAICEVGKKDGATHVGPVSQWHAEKTPDIPKPHMREKFPTAGEIAALKAELGKLTRSEFISDGNQCLLESLQSQVNGVTMMAPALKDQAANPQQWEMFKHFIVGIGHALATIGLIKRHWGIAGSAALPNVAAPFMGMALGLTGDQIRKKYFQAASAEGQKSYGQGQGKGKEPWQDRQPGQASAPGYGKRHGRDQWKQDKW